MAQRGRPRKIRPEEVSVPDRDAVVSATVSVDGGQKTYHFVVPNIAGHLIKSQRNPSAVGDVILAALQARFGQTVRAH